MLGLLQVKTASSNALFAAITEISDSVVRGAETNGLNGMVLLLFYMMNSCHFSFSVPLFKTHMQLD